MCSDDDLTHAPSICPFTDRVFEISRTISPNVPRPGANLVKTLRTRHAGFELIKDRLVFAHRHLRHSFHVGDRFIPGKLTRYKMSLGIRQTLLWLSSRKRCECFRRLI